MRRAAKVDRNQAEIVAAFRRCGAFVVPLHAVGGGVPDLLIIHRGTVHLVEVKDGAARPSDRRLTADQADWHAQALNHGYRVTVATGVDCALEMMEARS